MGKLVSKLVARGGGWKTSWAQSVGCSHGLRELFPLQSPAYCHGRLLLPYSRSLEKAGDPRKRLPRADCKKTGWPAGLEICVSLCPHQSMPGPGRHQLAGPEPSARNCPV